MDDDDTWRPDLHFQGEAVFNDETEYHAVHYLNNFKSPMNVGGKLYVNQLPPHYDYGSLRKTSAETRAIIIANA